MVWRVGRMKLWSGEITFMTKYSYMSFHIYYLITSRNHSIYTFFHCVTFQVFQLSHSKCEMILQPPASGDTGKFPETFFDSKSCAVSASTFFVVEVRDAAKHSTTH